MHGSSQCHKHVPDGVGEWDDAVALEEEDTKAVDEAAIRQLVKPLGVGLGGKFDQINEKTTSISNEILRSLFPDNQ